MTIFPKLFHGFGRGEYKTDFICVCICIYICMYVCMYIYGFPGGAVVKNIKYFSIMNENNFLSQKYIYICICVWCMLSHSVMSDFFVIP